LPSVLADTHRATSRPNKPAATSINARTPSSAATAATLSRTRCCA